MFEAFGGGFSNAEGNVKRNIQREIKVHSGDWKMLIHSFFNWNSENFAMGNGNDDDTQFILSLDEHS